MKRRIIIILLTVLFLSFIVVVSAVSSPAGTVQVSFISVGEGDAALIRDPSGVDILIDGGKPSAGPTVVAYLRAQGATDLDVMLASHADSDHIGGLIDVLQASDITVHQVLYNGYPGDTTTWYTFATAVANDGLALSTAQFPEVLNWGETTAYILNPDGTMNMFGTPEPNQASIVLLLKHGDMKFLFTGDIDYAIEATVVARNTPVAADVLKVAHHGSIYSSSWSFLSAVQPDEAVISVGSNTYGHPAPEVIANLELVGARVWRTDQQGTILIYSNGITLTVVASTPVPFIDNFLPLVVKEPTHNPTLAPTYTPTPTSTYRASSTPSPLDTNTPTPTVTRTAIPTATPTQVYTTGDVNIVTIFYDGTGSQEPDEYVEIRNDDTSPIQLHNWTLRDIANHVFTFPSYVMQVGQTCRVYTNQDHPEWCGFTYHNGSAIWNNTGDCGYLRDANNTPIDQYCY
jgi:competence protein ComEC